MKKYLLILLLIPLLLIYFNCKSSVTSPNNNNTNVTTVSGTIANWTNGAQTLQVNVGSSTILTTGIDNTGKFSFTFPTTIDSTLLSLFSVDTSCHGNVQVNPSNVKTATATFYVTNGTSIIGTIMSATHGDSIVTGLVQIVYVYVSTSGSVTGTDNCYQGAEQMTWNLSSISKGWNNIAVKYDSLGYIGGQLVYERFDVSPNIPSGLTWVFIHSADNKFLNPFKK